MAVPVYCLIRLGFLLALTFSMIAQAGVRDKDKRIAEVKGYSFEESAIPKTWKTSPQSALSLSKKHYKAGRQSLSWNWRRGSRLHVSNVKSTAKTGKVGAIRAWIYSEKPIDATLEFRFGTETQLAQNDPQYRFEFGLNYKGWRAMWVDLALDAEHSKTARRQAITAMEITAPKNIEAGGVFFDIIEFEGRMPAKRSADYQVPFVNKDSEGHWQQAYRWSQIHPVDPLPEQVTPDELEGFKTISERYNAWILGKNADLQDPLMKWRYDALQEFISKGVQTFSRLNIERDGENITGVPLFASTSPYGPKFSRHAMAESVIPLVLDYKANGNLSSRDKFFDLLDHLHDQGWAAGSANGSLDHELNRSSSYLQAVLLMKDELAATGRLKREKETMHWYTEMGEIYGPPARVGTTADRVITHLPYRLLSALTMEDGPEKVRTMRNAVRWMDNSFSIAPGWAGLIKPDYLAFHHKAHYGGAYGTPALQSAAFMYYLLNGTPFALSEQSHNNIKQALLFIRAYSNKYDIPVGISGRMPFTDSMLLEHVPAYAYLALSGDPVDEEMAGAFMRLWDPDSPLTKSFYVQRLTHRDAYVHTLGDLQLVIKAAALGIAPEPAPTGHWAKNYGSLSIHRRDDWMVSVRGHGKYVWDYEGHHEESDPENIFGRYQGHAALQIIGSGSPISGHASGYAVEGWDWCRWPNTTVIRLPLKELDAGSARNFTDRPFVGGLSHSNGNGIFVMDYHDTTFNESFYAKKSVFFFDDTIVCIGTNIQNDDDKHPTETTLFQGRLRDEAQPIWVNGATPVSTFPYQDSFETEAHVWLMDAYENGYYVSAGQRLNVHRKTQESLNDSGKQKTEGNFATAWLDHGSAPQGASYEFAIIVKSTPEETALFSRHPAYTVVQKNEKAHIVHHGELNMTAYVLFEKDQEFQSGPLKTTDAPCLIMLQENENRLELSLCDPDLRLMEEPVSNMGEIGFKELFSESAPGSVRFELHGQWDLLTQASNLRVVSASDGKTTIEVVCKDGMTTAMSLRKRSEN